MRRILLIMLGVLLMSSQLLAQNRTVTGRVTDEKGTPIPNASIVVKGTNIGVTTTTDGLFSISVPANARTLVVSSVGFGNREIALTSGSSYAVALSAAAGNLQEVVITGINRTTRSQFSGAATKISERQIENRPVGSFDQLFQGRVPGVLALTGSGQPGNSTSIIIRGTSSLQGGSSPLYIVDGIPVEAGVFQSLNPNDFESIDVLRDASATAVYGSRGSAGVIVVTTKRGQSGKMRLEYSGQYGTKSRPDFSVDMMNTEQLLLAQEDYGRLLNIGLTASAQTNLPGWYYSKNHPGYAGLSAAQQALHNAIYDSISRINTDWRDVFFRDGSFSNNQISLSGGTGKTRIYSSIAFYNEEGTTHRTDMKRATLRNNIDYADDNLTFGVTSNLGYTKRNFQQSTTTNSTANPFLVTSITAPYARLYNTDGTLATGIGNKFTGANAYDITLADENYNNQLKATLGINATYRITNDISAGLVAGIDFRETQNTNYGSKLAFLRRTSTSITGQAGFQFEDLARFVSTDLRPSLNFRKLIGDDHDVDVAVYGEHIRSFSKSFSLTGYGIDPRTPNTPAAITQGDATNQLYANVSGGRNTTSLLSGLITARYTFREKYSLTGSYRRDGSSKLPEENRWQGFYSIGFIWDAAKEDFMVDGVANTLRVKASYGSNGNSDNFPGGAYPYQATYTAAGNYSGIPTQSNNNPGNPDLMWETTYIANVGVDYGFLRNRIWGDVNVYDKRTKDLFVRRTLSRTSGFASIPNFNAGELQNKGVEFTVNADVVRNREVTFGVNANVAYNHNEILDLGGQGSYEVGTSRITVGLPVGSHYEVKWGGVDAATGAPLYYDANGNLTTNYALAVPVQEHGTWEAPWKGGFGGNVSFKGFEVSTLFSWQRGATKVDNLEYFMENPNGFLAVGFNQSSELNMWKKPGDIATTPNPIYNVNFSSKIIHKADFMRWRDLTVAYRLPQSVTERIKFISNARLYVQATNLAIWTNWRGMDPEAGPVNINLSEFPNPRAMTMGLDIRF